MSFENKRKYRKTIIYFQSKFEPQEIWEYLIHPKYSTKFTKDPCYYCEIPSNFALEKNHSWKDIHTGEDCEGDIITSVILDLKKEQSFSSMRHQSGIKNKTIFKLMKNENGTLISEEQIYSLSFKSISFLSVFSWLMLFTGILTRLTFKPDDDIFWFERMEEEIVNKLQT